MAEEHDVVVIDDSDGDGEAAPPAPKRRATGEAQAGAAAQAAPSPRLAWEDGRGFKLLCCGGVAQQFNAGCARLRDAADPTTAAWVLVSNMKYELQWMCEEA